MKVATNPRITMAEPQDTNRRPNRPFLPIRNKPRETTPTPPARLNTDTQNQAIASISMISVSDFCAGEERATAFKATAVILIFPAVALWVNST